MNRRRYLAMACLLAAASCGCRPEPRLRVEENRAAGSLETRPSQSPEKPAPDSGPVLRVVTGPEAAERPGAEAGVSAETSDGAVAIKAEY